MMLNSIAAVPVSHRQYKHLTQKGRVRIQTFDSDCRALNSNQTNGFSTLTPK